MEARHSLPRPSMTNMKLTILSVSFTFLVLHANAEGCDPGYYTTDTGCAKCPIGTYQNKVGADGCKPCPKGKVAVEEGSTSCIACPELMRPNSRQKMCNCIPGAERKGDGSCELCPPGTHFSGASGGYTKMCEDCDETSVQPMAGTMKCIRCKYGTFPNPERTKCIRCPDGQVRIGRKRICGMCPAGRYYDEYHMRCINCEPDTFKAAAGQGPCLPCSKNTHSPRGASECTECEEGLVLLRNGTCGKCKAGEYFDAFRTRRCRKCFNNRFMPYENVATICLVCPGHSFSGRGATECIRCQLGEFLRKSGVCGKCAPGQFYDKYGRVGEADCVDCSPGAFSRGGTVMNCQRCPTNSYSLGGAEACIFCPPGQALMKKTGECGTCPAGSHYESYRARCTKCYDGSYNDSPNVSDSCHSCPSGTDSNKKRTACT